MIAKKEFDSDFLSCIQNIKAGTSIQELIAAFITSALERNNGNRTWTSYEIKMPLRTLRNHLKYIEALGYTIPKYQARKTIRESIPENEKTEDKNNCLRHILFEKNLDLSIKENSFISSVW